MPPITTRTELSFLSELYVEDAPEAILLAEYPSSNTEATIFQNKSKFIIHDPFPPPRPELLKTLGPHHLMCGWGRHINVTSQVQPPTMLLQHWQDLFGEAGCPTWQPWQADDLESKFITLFPHESIPARQQLVDPAINYAIHSKEVIERMDCQQAAVLQQVTPPCIVKLSHGYAGLGNYLIKHLADQQAMQVELTKHWPEAILVVNSIVQNIAGDYGVQFYLRRDGSIIWLGFTEQNFSEGSRWCGGTFSASLQSELFESMLQHVQAAGKYLHSVGYFGLVGIDLLRDASDRYFLVDVNPRLTGITPFLMTSRIFSRDLGLAEGVYHASVHFAGSLQQLLTVVGKRNDSSDCRVVVLSAYEDRCDADLPLTLCHLSVTTNSQQRNEAVLCEVLSACS